MILDDFSAVAVSHQAMQKFRESFLPVSHTEQASRICSQEIRSNLRGYQTLGLVDDRSRYEFARDIRCWLDARKWLSRPVPRPPLFENVPLSPDESHNCRMVKLLSMLSSPKDSPAIQLLSLQDVAEYQWLTLSKKMAGHHPVRIVDDEKIRNESLSHEEFVEYAIHNDFPDMIPQGEIWIAKSVPEEERRFFIDAAMAEMHALDQGYSPEIAYEKGKKVQEQERSKNKGQFGEGKEPDKQDYGEIDDRGDKVCVKLIKGEQVRDLYKADFSQGGHGYVYPFVHKDEIWLDQDLMHDELPFILLHEATERSLMKHHKLAYDKAHEIASDVEDHARHKAPPTQWLAWQRGQSRSGGVKAIWTGPGFRMPLYGQEAEAALAAQEQAGTPTEAQALKEHVGEAKEVPETELTPEDRKVLAARSALDQVMKLRRGEGEMLTDEQMQSISSGLPYMSAIEVGKYREAFRHGTKDLFGEGSVRDMMERSIIRHAKLHHAPTVPMVTEEGGVSPIPPPGTTQETTGQAGTAPAQPPAPKPPSGAALQRESDITSELVQASKDKSVPEQAAPAPAPKTTPIAPPTPTRASAEPPKPAEPPVSAAPSPAPATAEDYGTKLRALYDQPGAASDQEIESTLAPLDKLGKKSLLRIANQMELTGMERRSNSYIAKQIKSKILNRRTQAQPVAPARTGEPNATSQGQQQKSDRPEHPNAPGGGKEDQTVDRNRPLGGGEEQQGQEEVEDADEPSEETRAEHARIAQMIREENDRAGIKRESRPLPIAEEDEEEAQYRAEAARFTKEALNGFYGGAKKSFNERSPAISELVSEQLGDRIVDEIQKRPLNRATLLRSLGANEADFDSAVKSLKENGKIEVMRGGLNGVQLFYRIIK